MPPVAPLPPLRKPSRPPTRKANLPNQKLLRFLGGAFLRRISAKRKLRKLENNLLTNHHGCANIIRPWGYSSAGSPVHSVTYPKVNFIKIVSKSSHGGIAQLGERLNGIQEVSGSIPLISTKRQRNCLINPCFLRKTGIFLLPVKVYRRFTRLHTPRFAAA